MTAEEIVQKELKKVEGKGALAEFVAMQNLAFRQTERVLMFSEVLTAMSSQFKCFVGPDDALGQSFLEMARKALEKE